MKSFKFLGIDTSNYTCSIAYYNAENREIKQSKRLLPVKSGEKGIRQSDAVFHHTMFLPEMLENWGSLCENACAIGVSDRPSCRKDSYMPCFMVGLGTAKSISAVTGKPYFTTTHQTGHILAALYSAGKLNWITEEKKFLAFHVSGGTTDLLLCKCGIDKIVEIEHLGGSSDLKAGQAVDRCGVMLGLDFPCGKELEKLALNCTDKIKFKPSIKGLHCSLSGVENKCRQLFESGADKSYIAAFCLKAIEESISALTSAAVSEYGELPVLYAGGVMSNAIIAKSIRNRFDAYFAEPVFSCDNAAGTAIFAAAKKGLI